jgi:hypothetical protein
MRIADCGIESVPQAFLPVVKKLVAQAFLSVDTNGRIQ